MQLYVIRRNLENAVITILSSVIIYILIKLGLKIGFLPEAKIIYLAIFGAEMLIFLGLNWFVLTRHFLALELSATKYLLINGSIGLIWAAASFAALKYASKDAYTALFGFTKVFREVGLSPAWSNIVIWLLYFLMVIAIVPLEKYRKDQFDDFMGVYKEEE